MISSNLMPCFSASLKSCLSWKAICACMAPCSSGVVELSSVTGVTGVFFFGAAIINVSFVCVGCDGNLNKLSHISQFLQEGPLRCEQNYQQSRTLFPLGHDRSPCTQEGKCHRNPYRVWTLA